MFNFKRFIHHLVVPSEGNNFRGRLLHHDFLAYYLVVAMALAFTFKYTGINQVLGFATDITSNKLLELTNKERQKNHLQPLNFNKRLSDAAQLKAQDMFQKNYWSHFAPDGTTPWNFILKSDYSYEFAGENLAKNFLFSQGAVDAWMNSKTHKENILRKDYEDVGFAIVNGMLNGEETTLVVQMFGKPDHNTIMSQQSPQNLPGEQRANNEAVIGERTSSPAPSPLRFHITSIFLIFLITILSVDFYIATRLNIIHVHGKHLAHIVFLMIILIGAIVIITNGVIL